ncbi:MAG: replication-associated recombination protein A [Kiritimatiellae bacterium]|jgi:putative ATPase|nr:replication-associated recombination protein A [Kiritimatiellia bacterium]NLD89014.1 replication-associated recombination protein A [Lentisphaerota bacterium]HPC18650.1 replication-associated recombination protein A [Kiritimatiellia bacterium]HQQ60532.1 replication-associated recombination protein A [Kiritimatiellia bacterium]
MNDLFAQPPPDSPASGTGRRPLAARMRPRTLEDIVGQDHILGPGKLLRRAIEADRLSSIILYGPAGCGKTSLAEVIARTTRRAFDRSSGVLSNVAGLRQSLEAAKQRRAASGRETILFIDEIHRFNKAQQDVLLPYVEEGAVTLIGATTHNPFFFINNPLTSRSQIFQLEPLNADAVAVLLQRALEHPDGLGHLNIRMDAPAMAHLAAVCEGDGRRALNALEIAALTTPPAPDGFIHITRAVAEESIQKKAVVYDHDEDGHYDTISAFIKSVRGSDPNAALYWLAKMLYAGEDPRFVARRLVILASEDIGNADPRGLSVAVAALEAVDFVGMPEARIALAQATTYLATAPKSNAAYLGIEAALADVKEGRTLPVPRHLRSTGSKRAAQTFGHQGYKYAHDFEGHFVDQEYVPTDKIYYEPTTAGYEDVIRRRIAHWTSLRQAARPHPPPANPPAKNES